MTNTALQTDTPPDVGTRADMYRPENIKLECVNLSKVYPTPKGSYTVLEGFSLPVYNQEFVAIIGHSGCGKSTVLSMIAGLNAISKGHITLDKVEISDPGPDRAVVFQSPSLFPWMTAMENVLLGVKQVYPHASKNEREAICKYYLDKVGLGSAFNRKALDMSNGMKQRVGIARAFALKPKVLLLDEPFGMLDSLTRAELQEVLMEVWRKERITAIMVTHDVDEAIYLSDRVIMMTGGPFAKVGDILKVELPRPRVKAEVIDHPDYYRYRDHLISFLEG
ncbi:MAG: ABC transporter ATP-binding protein [Bacteroidales bacterium]|nr:ABC transporter ATP-binding protein [Bacteroidales bacterium]